jgi:hypothetical protein
MWGKEKLAELLASKQHDGKQLYRSVTPEMALGLPFAPTQVEASYLAWPLLPAAVSRFVPRREDQPRRCGCRH